MPPRKSDVSKVATGDEGTPAKELPAREGINLEDLNLPKSIVTRLAKGVLPPNTQIQGNAMLAMTKSATVFVNYLATHANEKAQGQGRKTINPQDVFKALEDLEFPEFMPRLEAELAKFAEVQSDKRNTYRKKVAADKAGGKTGSPVEGEEEDASGDHNREGQLDRDGRPAAKKARTEPGTGEDHGDLNEGDGMGDKDDDEVDDDDGDETEEVDDIDTDPEETQQAEEHLEDSFQRGLQKDEALDNGEDSDDSL